MRSLEILAQPNLYRLFRKTNVARTLPEKLPNVVIIHVSTLRRIKYTFVVRRTKSEYPLGYRKNINYDGKSPVRNTTNNFRWWGSKKKVIFWQRLKSLYLLPHDICTIQNHNTSTVISTCKRRCRSWRENPSSARRMPDKFDLWVVKRKCIKIRVKYYRPVYSN